MKRLSFAVICLWSWQSLIFADTFGTGDNQFTIDFVDITGDASSVNGTYIGYLKPEGFIDPEYDYRIGVYEITNDQWNKFKAGLGQPVTGNPLGAYDLDVYWTDINVPTNSTSWFEAAQFVNWLNTSTNHAPAYKFTGTQGQSDYTFVSWNSNDTGYDASNPYRNSNAYYFLPTEDEWVKAAYWNGTELQDYATKPNETLHQGDGLSGTGWNYYNRGWATDPRGPWDVGSGSEELNGTYDMMGNVWEWVECIFDNGTYPDYHFRGGSYGNTSSTTNYLTSVFQGEGSPSAEDYEKGFRVASIPEPCTFVLFIAGSLISIRRK